VCVKIARALELEHALLLSSTRREPSAHGRVTSSAFACVCRPSCGNDAFFNRSDFPSPLTHTETLSVYPYDNTHSCEWRAEQEWEWKARRMNCCLRTIHLDVANVFSAWIWRGKIPSISFAEFLMLFYIPLLLINGKFIVANSLRKSCFRVFYFIQFVGISCKK